MVCPIQSLQLMVALPPGEGRVKQLESPLKCTPAFLLDGLEFPRDMIENERDLAEILGFACFFGVEDQQLPLRIIPCYLDLVINCCIANVYVSGQLL